jgi:fluoride exporter
MINFFLIFLGGGLGSLSRFGISIAVKNVFGGFYPVATFLSNIFSCIILSLFILFFHARAEVTPAIKFLVITGFCGGFSTFSAFSLETSELMRSGNLFIAVANILCNVVCCIAIVFFITKQS